MKRNLYCFIIMLFILSGCSQPAASTQAATAVQKDIPATLPGQSSTEKPTSTPIRGIRIETDPLVEPENLPVITLADFETGKVLEAEIKYLETHNPFNGNEIWPNKFKIIRINLDQIGKRISLAETTPSGAYFDNPYLIPARNFFFFKINLPKDFFPYPIKPAGKDFSFDFNNYEYVLLGQVWLNPNAEPNNPSDKYRIIHYPTYIWGNGYYIPGDISKTFLPLPVYSLDIKYIENDIKYSLFNEVLLAKAVYERFSKDTTKYLDEWVKTNRIPKELENFLLPFMAIKY